MTLVILDEKLSQRLASTAYKTFSGNNNAPQWDDLPQSTKENWIRMIDVIFLTLGEWETEQDA